jgi:hypothetical protein
MANPYPGPIVAAHDLTISFVSHRRLKWFGHNGST